MGFVFSDFSLGFLLFLFRFSSGRFCLYCAVVVMAHWRRRFMGTKVVVGLGCLRRAVEASGCLIYLTKVRKVVLRGRTTRSDLFSPSALRRVLRSLWSPRLSSSILLASRSTRSFLDSRLYNVF